jgi:hypothetical protein
VLEQNTMATPWRFPQKNHLKREVEEESAKKEWRSPLCRLDLISIYGAKIVDVRRSLRGMRHARCGVLLLVLLLDHLQTHVASKAAK